MKKLHEEILIDASREKVWDTIVGDVPYREWSASFQPGCYFVGGWNAGDSIKFLGKNADGQEEGMISEIAESRRPEFISIRHLGYMMKGIEDTTSDEIKKWAPSYENYTLVEENGGTRFILDMDVNDEFEAMFKEMWPKALQQIKAIAERS